MQKSIDDIFCMWHILYTCEINGRNNFGNCKEFNRFFSWEKMNDWNIERMKIVRDREKDTQNRKVHMFITTKIVVNSLYTINMIEISSKYVKIVWKRSFFPFLHFTPKIMFHSLEKREYKCRKNYERLKWKKYPNKQYTML